MPALLGGFGNKQSSNFAENSNNQKDYSQYIYLKQIMSNLNFQSLNSTYLAKKLFKAEHLFCSKSLGDRENQFSIIRLRSDLNKQTEALGSYLAGLIEGVGTFAVHNTNSTAKKYYPMIIVVFKKDDLPLAEYLKIITKCGNVYIKPDRGYVLWQIQDLVSIFNIIKIINGKMRTPKIEALGRTINWLNSYIEHNKFSILPATKLIVSKLNKLELKPLDTTSIDSNHWLSGFTDADGNFSINIHKRSNRKSTKVQLYYRMEIKQTYNKLDAEGIKASYFSIMSILANFLGVNVYSRSRILNNKQFYSFTVVAHNKTSQSKIIDYFTKYPLLSSKHLDYKDWLTIFKLAENKGGVVSSNQGFVNSYLDEALKIRTDFNKTRTTYNWDHLKNCYLTPQN